MAFVNLPPNLQDMFYALSDRIAKLETGPNQPGYDADAAQGLAVQASSQAVAAQTVAVAAQIAAATASAQAINAQSSALLAQAQAVSAQNTALFAQATAYSASGAAANASTQAIAAQSQANTALQQANTAYNQAVSSLKPSAYVISNASQQITSIATNGVTVYSGSSSSSGARVTMNSLGLAGYNSSGSATFSISASDGSANFSGSITGSTITGSDLNIGGNFYVQGTTGLLTATNVHLTGDITATSGTFTGTVQAQFGYIGTLSNGWNIGSAGLVGTGTGYIAGGTIQGTSFINGGGTFYVDASGNLTATSATIQGTINAKTGYFGSSTNGWLVNSTGITGVGSGYIAGGYIQGTVFTNGSTFSVDASGNLTSTSGSIGGFQIGSTYLSGSGAFFLNSSTGDATFNSVTLGFSGIYNFSSSGVLTASSFSTTGGGTVGGNLQVNSLSTVTYNSTNYNIGLFGTGSGGSVSGRMYKTTSVSSKRFKHNIEPFIQRDYLNIVSKLNPVTFNYNADVVDNPEVTAYGLIAEDVQEIAETEDLVNIGADGLPESIAYDRLQWYVIKSISQINDRLTKLEGK